MHAEESQKVKSRLSNVAVLIPTHKRFSELNNNERASLLQIKTVLKLREVYIIHPDYVNPVEYINLLAPVSCRSIKMNNKFFGSIPRSSRLLTSNALYDHFIDYDYILLHHLDAFVFSDDLDYWCNQELDYIGAPWIYNYDPNSPVRFDGVGNGGFSLRKVSSFRLISKNRRFVLDRMKLTFMYRFLKSLPYPFVKKFLGINFLMGKLHPHTVYEDGFWGQIVPKFYDWFRVGSPEQAVRFSFEVYPRTLFKITKGRLPFGCHAWAKNDPEFWKHFIPSALHGTA